MENTNIPKLSAEIYCQQLKVDQEPDKDGLYSIILRGVEVKTTHSEVEADLTQKEYVNRVRIFEGTKGIIGSYLPGEFGEKTGYYKERKYQYILPYSN